MNDYQRLSNNFIDLNESSNQVLSKKWNIIIKYKNNYLMIVGKPEK